VRYTGVVLQLISGWGEGGEAHLQYANDKMPMIEPSDQGITNLKLILLSF
jgi:hypothetical protein